MCLTRAVILTSAWQHGLVGSGEESHSWDITQGMLWCRRSGLSAQDSSAGHSNTEPECWHYLQTYPKTPNTGRTDPPKGFVLSGELFSLLLISAQLPARATRLPVDSVHSSPSPPLQGCSLPCQDSGREELSLQSTPLTGGSASQQRRRSRSRSRTRPGAGA